MTTVIHSYLNAIWGRPTKLITFGIAWFLMTLVLVNTTSTGLLRETFAGPAVGFMAGASLAAFIGGWIRHSHRWIEVGLLLAIFVFVSRVVALLFATPEIEEVLFGIGAVVIAAGAYLLEATTDEK